MQLTTFEAMNKLVLQSDFRAAAVFQYAAKLRQHFEHQLVLRANSYSAEEMAVVGTVTFDVFT